jgi:hypothetical protein
MNNVINIKSAPKTNLDYALAYAAIGWHVMPVWWVKDDLSCACGNANCPEKNRGKHPLTAGGQNDATTDERKIRAWWGKYPKLNIGIFLAPSNLVAVDIDPRNGGHETIETLEDLHGKIFSDVLQFTGGGGEHRIFTLPHGLQNLPGKLGAGIDLKLNGYIMVEPSNHTSGGVYEFEGSSDPLDGVAPSPLPDFIRDLSFNREQGDRFAFTSRYVTDEQILDLRSALTVIDADDRDTWIRVGNALKTIGAAGWNLFLEYSEKSDKFNYHDQRRVWASFKPHSINFETVFHIAQEAGWVNMPTKVESIIDLSLFQPKPAQPTELNRLPGILGEIEDYYNATAYIPQPQFAQQTALAIVSTMLGRRFKTEYDDYSSLYFACIAPSACGKEHVKTVSRNVLKACNKDLIAGDGYTSGGGVLSALKERPCHLSVIDEFGLYLQAANNKNNFIAQTATSLLMECIGRTAGEVQSKNHSTHSGANKDSSFSILNPAITLVGMTTPSTFYDALSLAMIEDGFFGRFLTVQSKMPRVPPRKTKSISVPKNITDWSESLDSRINDPANAFANPAIIGEQCVISVDDDAIEALGEFRAEMVYLMNELEPERIHVLAGRAGEFADRIALIMALSANAYATTVELEHATAAIAYVRTVTVSTVEDVRNHLIGSAYEKIKKEILQGIRLSSDGVTERDMHRMKPFSQYKDKELAEVLQSLVKSESIALVNTREGKPGKPRMAFIALELSN